MLETFKYFRQKNIILYPIYKLVYLKDHNPITIRVLASTSIA